MIFSKGNFSVSEILKKASQDFDLCMANFTEICTSQQWLPSASGYVKINADAAFIPNNGAAGVVARDHNGNFRGCASSKLIATSPLLSEAMDCNLGMQLGNRLNFHKLVIEGDGANFTAAVLGDTRDIPWSIRSEILKTKDAVNLFDDVKFQHVPKNVNFLAHSLCQYGMHNNVNSWWDENWAL
ncbi:uncharacterized protein LOC113305828 [Papaver somniferum]|uniref:uncharacterized protein LOC113305828 n=1 Tax=Papaver somniferum TaxID=3469 RepID=UPI000E6F54E5|nr:uncharacterized protein LOC113305828 [Papaver somniferum]